MKKGIMFILSVLLVFTLAACGNNDKNSKENSNGGDKKLKIGISYQNLQNEFVINIQNAVREKAKELNIDLIENDGQGKAENQISQVENFITQGVDAIILNPYDKNGAAPAVDLAVAANIPIVVVNAQVSNLEKATAYSGSDDIVAGQLEAQYVMDQIGGKGNVVIIHGPNGNSAEISRTEGNKEVLSKYPDVKILAEQTANWDRAQALSLMENWLQSYSDINAVIAQNDEMALGAYKAIEAAGKQDEIIVVGIDAIPDALKSVEEGKMAATVFQDAKGQGSQALELAIKAANGETVEHINYIPFLLVTKENVNDFK